MPQLTREFILRLQKAFNSFDKNKDGFLDEREVRNLLRTSLPQSPDETVAAVELDSMMGYIMQLSDVDGDGKINLQEFIGTFERDLGIFEPAVQRIARTLTREEVAQLKTTFQQVDQNKDGKVDEGELRALLSEWPNMNQYGMVDEIVSYILLIVDQNKDGSIDLTEFIKSFALEKGVLPADVAPARANRLASKLTRNEVEQLQRVFTALDIDHDGVVTIDHLNQELQDSFRAPVSIKQQVRECILACSPMDGDKIQLSTFCSVFNSLTGSEAKDLVDERVRNLAGTLTNEEVTTLKERFDDMDFNQDGFIDERELTTTLLLSFPEPIVLDAKDAIMAVADTNADGLLNFTEFKEAFHAIGGALPDEFPPGAKERMRAMQMDATGARAGISHEPRLTHDEQVNLDESLQVGANRGGAVTGGAQQGGEVGEDTFQAERLAEMIARATPTSEYEDPPEAEVSGIPGYQQIERTEASSGAVLLTDSQLRREFNRLDVDGSGWLSKEEFIPVYRMYDPFGDSLDNQEIEKMLKPFKSQGEDKITYDEFAIIMLKLIQK